MEKEAQKITRLRSATLEGLDARPVEVETAFTKGLPGFQIVGLGSAAIQESRERVKNQSSLNTIEVHLTTAEEH
ncbi:magnesium chelatase domain-containing protein [Hydrogenimonas sp.]